MNLLEFQQTFATERACLNHLEAARWGSKDADRFCPHCGSYKTYRYSAGRLFKCGDCRKQFTAKVGTIFSDSKVPLTKWYLAIYLASSLKKGISSVQLSKYTGVTQKTAWFMLHRIRTVFENTGNGDILGGTVEMDETYMGGKIRRTSSNTQFTNKTAVIGIVEKQKGSGRVKTTVTKHADATVALPFIRASIKQGTAIQTDESRIYNRVQREFPHEFVNHSKFEYARAGVTTNTIEGFWSHLKRGIDGIYHHVSPKHLQAYCNEYAYRYNSRKATDYERFDAWFGASLCRLTYKELTDGKAS